MTFVAAEKITVPRRVVDRTAAELQDAGDEGYEMFVLWSGHDRGDRLEVERDHVPRQTSYKTETGLLVRVDSDALHAMNVWLYEHGQMLIAQVHAHPTDAFHSCTDDAYPIVTTIGGFSIVAADFAAAGLLSMGTAVYRLSETGWKAVPAETVEVA